MAPPFTQLLKPKTLKLSLVHLILSQSASNPSANTIGDTSKNISTILPCLPSSTVSSLVQRTISLTTAPVASTPAPWGYPTHTYSVRREGQLRHSPAWNLFTASQHVKNGSQGLITTYKGPVRSGHWLPIFGPPFPMLQPCCSSHFSSVFQACSSLRVFALTASSA